MKKLLKTNNTVIRILFGTISGLFSAIIALFMFASVIVKYDISFEIIKYFWFVIFAVSSFVSSLICVLFIKSKKLLWGITSSIIVSLILLLILIFCSGLSIDLLIVLNIPIGLIFGFIGSLIIANKK